MMVIVLGKEATLAIVAALHDVQGNTIRLAVRPQITTHGNRQERRYSSGECCGTIRGAL